MIFYCQWCSVNIRQIAHLQRNNFSLPRQSWYDCLTKHNPLYKEMNEEQYLKDAHWNFLKLLKVWSVPCQLCVFLKQWLQTMCCIGRYSFKQLISCWNFEFLLEQASPHVTPNFYLQAGGKTILAGGEIQKKNQKRNLIYRFTNTKPQIWK